MNKDRQGRIKKEIQESELYKIYNEEGLCNGEFHAESLATAIAKEYVRRDEVEVETLAPVCYEVLERYKGHSLAEHEDRQDIGWATAEAIIEQMRDKE